MGVPMEHIKPPRLCPSPFVSSCGFLPTQFDSRNNSNVDSATLILHIPDLKKNKIKATVLIGSRQTIYLIGNDSVGQIVF